MGRQYDAPNIIQYERGVKLFRYYNITDYMHYLIRFYDTQRKMNTHPRVFVFPEFPPKRCHVKYDIIDQNKRMTIEDAVYSSYIAKYPYPDFDMMDDEYPAPVRQTSYL